MTRLRWREETDQWFEESKTGPWRGLVESGRDSASATTQRTHGRERVLERETRVLDGSRVAAIAHYWRDWTLDSR